MVTAARHAGTTMSPSVQVSKGSNFPIRSSATGNWEVGSFGQKQKTFEDILSLFPRFYNHGFILDLYDSAELMPNDEQGYT